MSILHCCMIWAYGPKLACDSNMKISSETGKAISLILIYTALLFFLIGLAGRMKSDFHYRATIAKAGFTTAAVFGAAGISLLAFSRGPKRE